jgi:hypothetical protein
VWSGARGERPVLKGAEQWTERCGRAKVQAITVPFFGSHSKVVTYGAVEKNGTCGKLSWNSGGQIQGKGEWGALSPD